MVFKSEFIVDCESKVSEVVNSLYCFIVSDDGVVGLRGAKKYFFCFADIEFEIVIRAPLGEVGDCVEVFLV